MSCISVSTLCIFVTWNLALSMKTISLMNRKSSHEPNKSWIFQMKEWNLGVNYCRTFIQAHNQSSYVVDIHNVCVGIPCTRISDFPRRLTIEIWNDFQDLQSVNYGSKRWPRYDRDSSRGGVHYLISKHKRVPKHLKLTFVVASYYTL